MNCASASVQHSKLVILPDLGDRKRVNKGLGFCQFLLIIIIIKNKSENNKILNI
jgi:hypothetical protein